MLVDRLSRIGDGVSWKWLQFGRTLIALGSFLTVISNTPETLFHGQLTGQANEPRCSGIRSMGLFCLVGDDLELGRWVASGVLLFAISGILPQLSGVLHWWVSFSLFNNMVTGDGGDQVANVITLLLLPILLTCPSWNAWSPNSSNISWLTREKTQRPSSLMRGARSAFLVVMALQISIIYFVSSVSKFGTSTWPQGTAVWYYIQDPIFGFGTTPFLEPAVHILSMPLVSILATWGTLAIEFGAAFTTLAHNVVVRRVRCFALIGLHSSIILALGLGSFGMQMIGVALLVYAINGHASDKLGTVEPRQSTGPRRSAAMGFLYVKTKWVTSNREKSVMRIGNP